MAVALLRWVVENEETPAVSVTSLRHSVAPHRSRVDVTTSKVSDIFLAALVLAFNYREAEPAAVGRQRGPAAKVSPANG